MFLKLNFLLLFSWFHRFCQLLSDVSRSHLSNVRSFCWPLGLAKSCDVETRSEHIPNCFHINKCLFKYYKWNKYSEAPPTGHEYAYVAYVEFGMCTMSRVWNSRTLQDEKKDQRDSTKLKWCCDDCMSANERTKEGVAQTIHTQTPYWQHSVHNNAPCQKRTNCIECVLVYERLCDSRIRSQPKRFCSSCGKIGIAKNWCLFEFYLMQQNGIVVLRTQFSLVVNLQSDSAHCTRQHTQKNKIKETLLSSIKQEHICNFEYHWWFFDFCFWLFQCAS